MERTLLCLLIGAFLFGPWFSEKVLFSDCGKKGGIVLIEPGLIGFRVECLKVERIK